MKNLVLRYGLLLLVLFAGLFFIERIRKSEEVVTIGGPDHRGEGIYRAYRARVQKTGERQRATAAAAE